MPKQKNERGNKVPQGCVIFRETKEIIIKVREKNFPGTPTQMVSQLVEKVFSKQYELEDALEEVKKLKAMANEVPN